jgi:hypothetical protein
VRTAERQRGRRYGLSEREGRDRANERQGQVEGGGARGLHLGARATWASRGAWAWARFNRARGACHGRGGCGGGDESDGQGLRASESGCARARNCADGAVPLARERRGERASERDTAPTGGAHLSADACARGRAASWVEWAKRPRREGVVDTFPFSFILNFLVPFLLFFSFGFKIKNAPKSNSNSSNMCIKQKNNLVSA